MRLAGGQRPPPTNLPKKGGGYFEISASCQEVADDLFALLRLERADRVDERAARLQPLRRAVEQLALQLGAFSNDTRPRAVEHLRMAAEGAGGRAGRVEQDGAKLPAGLPCQRVSLDQLGFETRALQIFAQ